MKNICLQMTRKAWLVLVMVLACTMPALAQKITVSGTVYEPDGEPAIGASVVVQGATNQAAATDYDGNFRLTVNPDAVLVVSYVGYETQEVPVNGQEHLSIHLKTNTQVLSDLVVVGYGVVKKSDATGSVAVIKPDDVEAGIATTTQDLLVGASPGVTVTTDGGNPTGGATIRIRGGASLSASNEPLIVIDGVPMTNQSNAGNTNAMTMVNPQNIESLTILKDASATAIYGSRASNGVIIITTKKGTKGKPQVNFAANFHINTARNYLNLMTGDQFYDTVKDVIGTDAAIGMLGKAGVNTDWQKEVLRTTFSHDYSLSVGGQAGVLPYRVAASYTDNQGILKTSGMQRTTASINLSPKFFDNLLQINANVNGSYVRSRTADQGAIGAATSFNPTLPVYTNYKVEHADPTHPFCNLIPYNGYTNILTGEGKPNTQATQNPLQMLLDQKSVGEVFSSTGNIQFDYALHFLPELHFNLNLGYQVSKNQSTTDMFENSIMQWRNNGLIQNGTPGAATHYKWYELQRNTLLDFYINYRKEFEKIQSNLDVMLGYSWQHFDYHGRSQTYLGGEGINMAYDGGKFDLDYMHTADKVGYPLNNNPMSHWSGPSQLLSFFGRLNYSFKDTYLLTFTLRDDATSRFSKDTRWGLFPSVALGWKLINYMPDAQSVMNDMKLRLGWGVTGQQEVGLFPYLPIYTLSKNEGFQYPVYGGADNQMLMPIYPNPYESNIKWEETTTWNVGLDLAFLNNRITAALDWYLRNTKDLLAYTPVVGVNTCNYTTRNIGSLRNTGFEITLGAKPVVTRDFIWNTGINVAYNRNKITALTGDAETSVIAARDVPVGTGGALQYHLVGEPAYTFRVYQQVYDNDGNPIPGQYVDQNGDGKITDQDKISYHSPEPTTTVTWNNNFSYKNWDLGFVLRANFNNYMYNGPKFDRTRLDAVSGYQLNNLLADTFLFDTTDSFLTLSDYFVENASFVRCDNITLGYTFDNLLNNKLNLRLFGAVQNPFVITKYKGLDPEKFDGIDNNVYPRPITCTLGLVATF